MKANILLHLLDHLNDIISSSTKRSVMLIFDGFISHYNGNIIKKTI